FAQWAPPLSGGEAQRVKLATELAKRDTGRTLYILDEPTTGLHFEDVRLLLEVLHRLVDRGNPVVVIQHHLEVIKTSDRVLDISRQVRDERGNDEAGGSRELFAPHGARLRGGRGRILGDPHLGRGASRGGQLLTACA